MWPFCSLPYYRLFPIKERGCTDSAKQPLNLDGNRGISMGLLGSSPAFSFPPSWERGLQCSCLGRKHGLCCLSRALGSSLCDSQGLSETWNKDFFS